MATLRRGLVDTVKKAASKVGTRGVQVASKVGTRGARALVEGTVAAVKTVDKLQEKLGQRSRKARPAEAPMVGVQLPRAPVEQPGPLGSGPVPSKRPASRASKTVAKPAKTAVKPRRAAAERTTEASPVASREVGRKTMPAAAPKRSKPAQTARKQFKVKRGQKHLHSGR